MGHVVRAAGCVAWPPAPAPAVPRPVRAVVRARTCGPVATGRVLPGAAPPVGRVPPAGVPADHGCADGRGSVRTPVRRPPRTLRGAVCGRARVPNRPPPPRPRPRGAADGYGGVHRLMVPAPRRVRVPRRAACAHSCARVRGTCVPASRARCRAVRTAHEGGGPHQLVPLRWPAGRWPDSFPPHGRPRVPAGGPRPAGEDRNARSRPWRARPHHTTTGPYRRPIHHLRRTMTSAAPRRPAGPLRGRA